MSSSPTFRDRPAALAVAVAFAVLLLGHVPLAGADAATAPTQDPEAVEATMEQGRQATQWFYEGDLDRLWSRFTDRMKEAMKGEQETLEAFRRQVDRQLGAELQVADERTGEAQGFDIYRRTATFEKFDGPVNVQWAFDDQGRIGGFTIRPAQQSGGNGDDGS